MNSTPQDQLTGTADVDGQCLATRRHDSLLQVPKAGLGTRRRAYRVGRTWLRARAGAGLTALARQGKRQRTVGAAPGHRARGSFQPSSEVGSLHSAPTGVRHGMTTDLVPCVGSLPGEGAVLAVPAINEHPLVEQPAETEVEEAGSVPVRWFQPSGGKRIHLSWTLPKGLASVPLCQDGGFGTPDTHRGTGLEQARLSGHLCRYCSAVLGEGRATKRRRYV